MESNLASKRMSIYVPEHLQAMIDLRADSAGVEGASQRIAAILDRYGLIVRDQLSRSTASRSLSRAEWMIILDACNGWAAWSQAGDTLMSGIALEVHDHDRLNGGGEKWGLSRGQVNSLVEYLRYLPPAETMAMIERIERFWRRSEMGMGDAMEAAGIVCQEHPDEPTDQSRWHGR